MLKQRVITALILVAILLPTLAAQALWPFSLLTLVFISAAGGDGSRLNEAPGARAVVRGVAVARGCLAAAHYLGLPVWSSEAAQAGSAAVPHVHDWGEPLVGFLTPSGIWLGAVGLWVLGGALALRHGTAHWKALPQIWRRLLGLV